MHQLLFHPVMLYAETNVFKLPFGTLTEHGEYKEKKNCKEKTSFISFFIVYNNNMIILIECYVT